MKLIPSLAVTAVLAASVSVGAVTLLPANGDTASPSRTADLRTVGTGDDHGGTLDRDQRTEPGDDHGDDDHEGEDD